MRSKWVTLALAATLALPATAAAQRRSDSGAAKGPSPVIEIPVTSHDFGDVYKEGKFLHAFTAYNRGGADLIIEEVKPG